MEIFKIITGFDGASPFSDEGIWKGWNDWFGIE